MNVGILFAQFGLIDEAAQARQKAQEMSSYNQTNGEEFYVQ